MPLQLCFSIRIVSWHLHNLRLLQEELGLVVIKLSSSMDDIGIDSAVAWYFESKVQH